eukprot:scaffold1019_cov255-Pinguiococcus_pyrenoidosus.AAC.19
MTCRAGGRGAYVFRRASGGGFRAHGCQSSFGQKIARELGGALPERFSCATPCSQRGHLSSSPFVSMPSPRWLHSLPFDSSLSLQTAALLANCRSLDDDLIPLLRLFAASEPVHVLLEILLGEARIRREHLLVRHEALQQGCDGHAIDLQEHAGRPEREDEDEETRQDEARQLIGVDLQHEKVRPGGRDGNNEDLRGGMARAGESFLTRCSYAALPRADT